MAEATKTTEVADVKGPVTLPEEKKVNVVVSINLSEQLTKNIEEFNSLAARLKEQDEKIKKAQDTLGAERNQIYTRAVELQGTIRYLQSQIAAQEKTPDKTPEKK